MERSAIDKLFTVTNTLRNDHRNKWNAAWRRRPNVSRQRAKRAAKPVFILGLGSLGQKRMLLMGRLVMYATFVTFLGGYLSYEWVCRVVDTSEHDITPAFLLSPGQRRDLVWNMPVLGAATISASRLFCFGMWKACDKTGRCYKVWTKLQIRPFYVTMVMVLATGALLGYACAIILDVASRVSVLLFLGTNRVVEFCIAVSAVIHFLAMLHFTGLVKNMAPTDHLVRDATGWGFVLAVLSMVMAVMSVAIMAIFRTPPGKHKHRRFWKLPADLRPRPYLSILSSGGACYGTEAMTGRGGGGVGGGCARSGGAGGDVRTVPRTKGKDSTRQTCPSRRPGDESV